MPTMKRGYVYIMTNAPSGALYIGVTSNIAARDREGTGSEFCREHGLTRLVYVEEYPTIQEAIAREKAMKAWQRAWKPNLIRRANPKWDDLYSRLTHEERAMGPCLRWGDLSF
jgi:putative endonuclease